MQQACTNERGQATVEVALVVPFVITLLLALVQVALVVRGQILVTHAARDAARAAAVDPTEPAALDAIHRDGVLSVERVEADVSLANVSGSELVTVEVTYQQPTDVPLVGSMIGDIALRASVTIVVEDQRGAT